MNNRYSKVAIAFHWVIAALIVSNFVLASMAEDAPKAIAGSYMASHKALGISILALLAGDWMLRVIRSQWQSE